MLGIINCIYSNYLTAVIGQANSSVGFFHCEHTLVESCPRFNPSRDLVVEFLELRLAMKGHYLKFARGLAALSVQRFTKRIIASG